MAEVISVIGAGTMGSGITITAAASGIEVCQVDVSSEQLDRAKAYHSKTLRRNVEKERMTQAEADATLSRIQYSNSHDRSGDSAFAIEAATENIEIKKKIFGAMVSTYSTDCILATNTSSISIAEIGNSIGRLARHAEDSHPSPCNTLAGVSIYVGPLILDSLAGAVDEEHVSHTSTVK